MSLKKKWNRAASTFIALIPSRLIRQMLHGWLSLELNSKGLYQSSGKEKENWCFVFPSSTKREIRHCTMTAKKCTKKRDAHAKLLYCQSQTIGFLPFSFRFCPGTALQLRKPIYNSVNAIYKYTTRHPTLHVELNSVNSPWTLTMDEKMLNSVLINKLFEM